MLRYILIVFFAITTVNCAKILVVYPLSGKSHYILGNAVARTLCEAGHDIWMISPFKENNPPKTGGKWTDIQLEGVIEARKKEGFPNMFNLESVNPILFLPFMNQMGTMLSEYTLNHTAVQNLLKSDAKFDVVIVEQFINDALKGLAWHYKAPLIAVSSLSASSMINPHIANPSPVAYLPDLYLSYSQHMTFLQRTFNTIMYVIGELNRALLFFPAQNRILHKYFPEAPHINDIAFNISLAFLNSHISTSPAKPHVPVLQEIGGYHISPPKKLPEDLQKFLDEPKEGVVYFSMGSNLKSADMPEEKLQAILKALSKLKQKVLWKFEKDLPNKPSNVKIMAWCPQQDILAHPNIKAFITHGGLLSSTETIYHGVPVLVIPIFGDQKLNAAQYVFNGLGVSLPYQELTEETLTLKLHELLNNPKYGQNAKLRSKIFHDRQVKPKENLVYWTEYVIRHQGAPHLRVAGLDLAWYQYFLIDVVAFLASISLAILAVFYWSIKWLCCKRKVSNKLKTN